MYGIRIICNNTSCNCSFRNETICNYLLNNPSIQLEYIKLQLNEFYTTNQPTFSNLQAYKNYEEEHIQEVKKLETTIIGTMLNILQSDKLALLNLNHNFLAVQFIAKYKLKQCHGFRETK